MPLTGGYRLLTDVVEEFEATSLMGNDNELFELAFALSLADGKLKGLSVYCVHVDVIEPVAVVVVVDVDGVPIALVLGSI